MKYYILRAHFDLERLQSERISHGSHGVWSKIQCCKRYKIKMKT